MGQVVSTLGLVAALAALALGLWHDWGLLATVKRMAVGYLGFYFLGSFMVLAVKFVGVLENNPSAEDESGDKPTSTTQ